MNRLFLITGKGGVGKTVISQTLFRVLQEKKIPVTYVHHNPNAQGHYLDRKTCIEDYLSSKLRSQTFAKILTKTPFFYPLIDMIPGLEYVLYLGTLINNLIEKKNRTVVYDCPSTGHAQTLLESLNGLQRIFRSGILFNDLKKMHNFLTGPQFSPIIVSLPTILCIQETQEFQEYFKNSSWNSPQTLCNSLISQSEFEFEKLPHFLQERYRLEEELLEKNDFDAKIPYKLDPEKPGILDPYLKDIL